jgi:tRNA (guanine-N7-)-methyltransferase
MRSFSPEKVPLPPDFRALAALAEGKPLDVEIGCGVGMHPIRYARANGERRVLAFERTSEKFAKFAQRLTNHDPLPNLTAIHGDAVAWITHALPPASVDRYFILYPNPYPKESQRNLRFHEMPFFSRLKESLKTGGELVLATNEEFYAREAKTKLVADWGLFLREEEILRPDFPPRTHFEKKYLARGERCWNLIFYK